MSILNLPEVSLKIITRGGKHYVLDPLRKRYVRLTPEEEVRQRFVSFLVNLKGYPLGLLANEVSIELGSLRRRCDTVLYTVDLEPLMIVEYKAPSVQITQDVFDQIARYAIVLPARWLVITNGIQHFCCLKQRSDEGYVFVRDIPEYEKLRLQDEL